MRIVQTLLTLLLLAPFALYAEPLESKCLVTCEDDVIQKNPQCGQAPIGDGCQGLLQSQVEACVILKCKVGSEFELGGEGMGPKMCALKGTNSRKPASQNCAYKR